MGCLGGAAAQANNLNAPQHTVSLPSFYMQEVEATNGEVHRWVQTLKAEERPKTFESEYAKARTNQPDIADNLPAVSLNHSLAEKYCVSQSGDLPTEAQWEYAARSGSTHGSLAEGNPYVWSYKPPSSAIALKERGNIQNEAGPVVGGKFPFDQTEQGIFDMAGNVQEWCRDVFDRYENDNPGVSSGANPSGPPRSGNGQDHFVIRGGSFDSSDLDQVQTTTRFERPETDESGMVGFRMVLEPPDFSPGAVAVAK